MEVSYMQFSNNEVATYLYCAQLPQTRTTPLTILEWNAVVKSLSELKKQPEILLNITSENLEKVITKATESHQ